MGRLFWKIFFWFWLTMILMTLGIALGTAQFFQQEQRLFGRPLTRLVTIQVDAVSAVLKYSGESAAKAFVQEIADKSPLQLLVLNTQNKEIIAVSEAAIVDINIIVQAKQQNKISPILKRTVISPVGRHYQIMAWLPERRGVLVPLKRSVPFALFKPFHREPWQILVRFGIAILVSGMVCFWLAWYLASPVQRLREANRRLSRGELSVRIGNAMGKRRDEIADLGQDFDCMAEHLQTLILTQKQLLNDVSHELRSPLARLQVALGLARKKMNKQADKELDRIEQEANRLDELVGQVLTLARLEVLEPDRLEDYVDIITLLDTIIEDAEFEATSSNRHVIRLYSNSSWTLKANAELLRRALENIVRNAIRYTSEGTSVEVQVKQSTEPGESIYITICDHGVGIPQEKLALIFEPFVRLSEARERSSGGYGLGLAIAERAIRLHGGKVSAVNRDGGGLCVQTYLPVLL